MSERKLEMTLHPDLAKRLDEVVGSLTLAAGRLLRRQGVKTLG